MTRKKYKRSDFRKIPRDFSRLLASLETFEGQGAWPRDYRKLADMLRETDPFTILLFAEPLARAHWRFKRYVSMRRVEIVSELDETVFRRFGSEINRRMAEYLESHPDPDDVYLHELVRE